MSASTPKPPKPELVLRRVFRIHLWRLYLTVELRQAKP